MNKKLQFSLIVGFLLVCGAALAIGTTYRISDTLPWKTGALEVNGDINVMGNEMTNVSAISTTNITATRATITDGSAISGISGTNIASGTVADGRVASTIARDTEIPIVSSNRLILSLNFNNNSYYNISNSINFMDASGKNNHLTTGRNIIGRRDFGGVGNSSYLFFNGTNDYIKKLNTFSSGNLSTNGLTISMWVNVSYLINNGGTGITQQFFELCSDTQDVDSATSKGIHFYCDYNACRARIRNGSSSYTALNFNITPTNIRKWHHIVLVAGNNQNVETYTDGKLYLTTTATQKLNYAPYNILIGRGWTTTKPANNMSIDDVQIWNRRLSPTEISNLYTQKVESQDSYIRQRGDMLYQDNLGRLHSRITCINDACNINMTTNVSNPAQLIIDVPGASKLVIG